jgi:TPP-dependent pyruvate/acetoin dehydrogenase alpha subunit
MARPNEAEWALASDVLRVRLSQLLINEGLKRREFKVPVHLALGHEAIATAVSAAMGTPDALCLTHRNLHYNLARGSSLAAEIAELRLEAGGVSGGAMGCMNMINPKAGIPYSSSILGNCLSVSTGVALASTVTRDGSVTFVATGDGAIEEGSFWETLEFHKSLALPAIVVVENNGWAMWTKIDERRCPIDIASAAKAFDAPYVRLAGNDVVAYAETLSRLRDGMTGKPGPVVVEVALSTLGDIHVPVAGGAPRYVNYHHGPAPETTLADWPVLRESEADPVFALTQRFDRDRLQALARSLRAELEPQCR